MPVDDLKEKKGKWLLDSACSRHMTGDKRDLVKYKQFDKKNKEETQYVTLADKSVIRAEGQGNLNVNLFDEFGKKVPVTFYDVLYVPNMERLVSVGQLTKRGAEVTFRQDSAILNIRGRLFQFGTRLGKLFKMNWCNFVSVYETEPEENREKIEPEENREKIEPEENREN